MTHLTESIISAFLRNACVFSAVYTVLASLAIGGTAPPSVPAALSPPGQLRVTETMDSCVTLAWNMVAGAGSYRIYRSTLAGQGFVMSAALTAIVGLDPVFTECGLVNQVTYYYRVTTLTPDGNESSASAQVAAMPALEFANALINENSLVYSPGGNAPIVLRASFFIKGTHSDPYPNPAPSILSQVIYGPSGQAPAQWTHHAEAQFVRCTLDGYQHYQAVFVPDPTLTAIEGVLFYTFRFSSDLGNSWTYAGVDFMLQYPELFTENKVGVMAVHADTDDSSPTAPLQVWVESPLSTSMTVRWTAGADTDGSALFYYDIFRGVMGGPQVLAARVKSEQTSYIDYGLLGATDYEYSVRSVDKGYNYSTTDPQANPLAAGTTRSAVVPVTINIKVPDFTPFQSGLERIYINRAVNSSGTTGIVDWNAVPIPCDLASLICTKVFGVQEGADFRFQISRGIIETIETTSDGYTPVPEHRLAILPGNSATLNLTVYNWDDPLVTAYSPTSDSSTIPGSVSIIWNQVMPVGTTFTVEQQNTNDPPVYLPVNGQFDASPPGSTVTFTPQSPFKNLQTVRVRSGQPSDLNGISQQAAFEWTFTSGSNNDSNRTLLPFISGP